LNNFFIEKEKYMESRNQKGSSQPDNPGQDKSWRSDVPEIPESEDQPEIKKEPGTRQNVREDQQQNENYLTKEDLPDASNESKGKMGSGQRQDSN